MLEVDIIVQDYIDKEWGELLCGLEVSHSRKNQSVLRGTLQDQAAVYGVIARMRDLGMAIASIRIDEGGENGNAPAEPG